MLQQPERDGLRDVIELLHRIAETHSLELTIIEISEMSDIEIAVTHLLKLFDLD